MVNGKDVINNFFICLSLVFLLLVSGCQEDKEIEAVQLDEVGFKIIEQAIHTPQVVLWFTEDTLFHQMYSSFRIISSQSKPFCDYNLIYNSIYLLDGKEYYSPLRRTWVNQNILPLKRIRWSNPSYSKVNDPYVNVFVSDIFSDGHLQYFSANFITKTGETLTVWLLFEDENLKQVISCK